MTGTTVLSKYWRTGIVLRSFPYVWSIVYLLWHSLDGRDCKVDWCFIIITIWFEYLFWMLKFVKLSFGIYGSKQDIIHTQKQDTIDWKTKKIATDHILKWIWELSQFGPESKICYRCYRAKDFTPDNFSCYFFPPNGSNFPLPSLFFFLPGSISCLLL
jgi:hypothetical protein